MSRWRRYKSSKKHVIFLPILGVFLMPGIALGMHVECQDREVVQGHMAHEHAEQSGPEEQPVYYLLNALSAEHREQLAGALLPTIRCNI